MTRTAIPSHGPEEGGQVVRPPRPADAIGQALRRAFARRIPLPAGMQAALDRLDLISYARH